MKLLSMLLFCSFVSKAMTHKKNFCLKKTNHKTILEDLTLKENLLSFRNAAGLFNRGVCWWHNRLQRKAQYLVSFDKHSPKLKEQDYKKIIRKMIKGKEIITIKGYANLRDFSADFKDYILKRLTLWQVRDGSIGFAWIRGLRGKRETSSEKLKKSMNELYNYTVNQENISYVKLQLKGIESHSWLITSMNKTPNGYNLHFLDSNAPNGLMTYQYFFGDTTLNGFRKYGDFLIYLEEKKEMREIKKAVKTFCEL